MLIKPRPRRGTLYLTLLLVTLTASGCRKKDFPQYSSNYREYAYIANSGSDTVTALDLVNLRQDREIQVGRRPVALATSPLRNEIYVVNSGSGSISLIDAEHNEAKAQIPVGHDPAAIVVSADGNRAWVANTGSNSVSLVDLAARRLLATIGVGEQPTALALSTDGRSLVVANHAGNSITMVDAQRGQVRDVITGCTGASSVKILPDSSKAFIACSGNNRVQVIHLAAAPSLPGDTPAEPDRELAMLRVGIDPVFLTIKPDGGEVFVSNAAEDSVSEISTSTNDVGGASTIGAHPAQGIVSRDNSTLYVSNEGGDTVGLYSIDEGRRTAAIRVGSAPGPLSFSSAGHLLLVANQKSGDVAVLRTRTPASLFTMLPCGRAPADMLVKAFTVR